MTPTATPIPPFYCACGATTFETEAEQHAAQPDGRFKCPLCKTFASDHEWSGDESSDWRCYWCDTRSGSHGGPDSGNAVIASYTFERALANGGVEA
jgi:hypothetical protein